MSPHLMSQNDSPEQELDHLRQQVADLTMERTLFCALLDSLPFYAFTRDAEARFVFSNQAHRTLLGVTSDEEYKGKTDLDFFPAEDAAGYVEEDQRVIASGQPLLDYEETVINEAGERRWLTTNKIPVFDDQGNIIGLCGTNQDITERKAEHEALRQHQELVQLQKEALHELSTPIIPIMDRMLVMPLVGAIDTVRARDIMRGLLAGISEHRAQVVILDITGVPIVDSGVAEHLNKTIQAARLKGARTIITGISDAVAETIVDLGIDWSSVETLRDLQTGLITALNGMGIHLQKTDSNDKKA